MNKLNNKGQTLVLFIIFIPIFLMIFAMIVDLSTLTIEKHELESATIIALKYGLNHKEENDKENKMIEVFNLNTKDAQMKIQENNDVINIKSEKKVKTIFSKIIGKDLVKLEINIEGNKKDNKYKIKKN